jgi:hypothetical protein
MTDSSRHYEQRTLECLAHKLDLDFEYSETSGAARISRPDVPNSSSQHSLDMLAWPLNINSSVDPKDIFWPNNLNSSTLDETQELLTILPTHLTIRAV